MKGRTGVGFHHLSHFRIGTSSSFCTASNRLSDLSTVILFLKNQGMDLGLLVFIYMWLYVHKICQKVCTYTSHTQNKYHWNLLGRRFAWQGEQMWKGTFHKNLLKCDSC